MTPKSGFFARAILGCVVIVPKDVIHRFCALGDDRAKLLPIDPLSRSAATVSNET
ncbi:hypothetical protein SAMN05216482_2197 [Streptomyces sp. PAN_FS17]|nr:hypothetical protein SAMN05216482_2197 [Streptomyces sp. PAN_FS17]